MYEFLWAMVRCRATGVIVGGSARFNKHVLVRGIAAVIYILCGFAGVIESNMCFRVVVFKDF
jgi:uncharacterized membrane protein YuzA (DUF378 family)